MQLTSNTSAQEYGDAAHARWHYVKRLTHQACQPPNVSHVTTEDLLFSAERDSLSDDAARLGNALWDPVWKPCARPASEAAYSDGGVLVEARALGGDLVPIGLHQGLVSKVAGRDVAAERAKFQTRVNKGTANIATDLRTTVKARCRI